MRLSNNLIYKNNLGTILTNQQRLSDAQERVNTQRRVLTPSDDPSASAQAMLYSERIEINEQYNKNYGILTSRLETEESVLINIKDSIQRAHTLTIQAGNGALSSQDKLGISEELKSLQATLVDLMNARAEDGKYIFSGYQDDQQAYQYNQATGDYDYQGDQGNLKIQVAEGVAIESSDNGFNTFEKVAIRRDVVSNAPTLGGSATSGSVYVKEQGAFDTFHKQYYDPFTPANNQFTVDINAGSYQILRAGAPLAPPVTGTITGEPIRFGGMEIEVALAGAAGTADFTLKPPGNQNVLNTLNDLVASLEDPTLLAEDYEQRLATGLVQLENAKEKVSLIQAGLGGRMNAAERISLANADLDVNNKESRAKLMEVDMVEAVSELQKQETALQASQATFGRLSQLSLFDYIR